MTTLPGYLGGAGIPVWPDFGVELLKTNEARLYSQAEGQMWRASTDTKRPGTPVFSIWFLSPYELDENEARVLLGERLRAAYDKAHPNGCGSR